MTTGHPGTQGYDFDFPRLDTVVRVEECDGRVVIRATCDTFSAERKSCFVHELAEEGFISDRFRWCEPADTDDACVRWVVDHSWGMPGEAAMGRTRRLVMALFGSATLLWLILLGGLLLR